MLRKRRLQSSVCLWAGVLVASTQLLTWTASTACADPADGTLTVVVDRDVDGNASYDATADTPQPGIGISVSDSSGATVKGVTDSDGTFVLKPSEKLDGGRYFVVAEIPGSLADLVPIPENKDFQAMSTTVDLTGGAQSLRMGVAARAVPTEEPPTRAPVPPPAAQQRAEPLRFAVGDTVWQDTDNSGQQNPAEPGADKVSVQLLNGSGRVVASTVTSSSGHYVFDDLPGGVYSVRFAGIRSGFVFDPAGRGTDPGRDSDPDYTGETPPFTLGVNEANVRPSTPADHVSAAYLNPSIDAGIAAMRYAVADHVWLDVNHDGIRQSAEPGAAATVTLLTAKLATLATTTTDDQGRYSFTGLTAGSYRLQFVARESHRALTAPRAGNDPADDSDPSPSTGITGTFNLDQNAPNLVPAGDAGVPGADLVNATIGAGLVGAYSIGDTVWEDNNGDGVFDTGDVGVEGVKVQLLAGNSTRVLATTITNRTGRYTFTGLAAGAYRLRFVDLPAKLRFVPRHAGNNSAVDSDADPQGYTPVVTLGDDDPSDSTLDAGVASPANVQQQAPVASDVVTPAETTLSSTGGVAAGIPVIGALLAVSGVGCLLLGRLLRRRRR